MRSACSGACALALAAALTPSAAAEAKGGCGLAGAHVVYRAKGDLVVRQPPSKGRADRATFACRAARPKLRTLIDGGNPGGSPTGNVRLGPYAARDTTLAVSRAYGDGSADIYVVDLATHQKLADLLPTTAEDTYIGIPSIAALRLGAPGEIAWVAVGEHPPGGGSRGYEVIVQDTAGTRTLAGSADILPRSLAVHGGFVSWIDGGKAMRAPA